MQFITGILVQNNKVIVAVDTNKHVRDGVLPNALKNLGLIEVHATKFDLPHFASTVTMSLLIDSAWVSNNITLIEVLVFQNKF